MSGQYRPQRGEAVRIQDAAGDWHDATAASGVERGDKFPIVWVDTFMWDGKACRLPWPLGYIEPAEQRLSDLPNCDSTNCVCCSHEGWPKRTGAFWTHLYSESPKWITPRGDRPPTQYVVVER